MHQWPDESRRTARGCPWIAVWMVDGKTYHQATSRSGAPLALARILVAEGVPDQPVSVTSQGLKGEMRYPSLHKMAGYTIEESATMPVRQRRWVEYRGKVEEQKADLAGDVSPKIEGKEVAG